MAANQKESLFAPLVLSSSRLGCPTYWLIPTLELHDGAGALIGFNDNWQTTIIGGVITHDQVQEILNSGRAPTDMRESAIIADLPAGNYTAIVRGAKQHHWSRSRGSVRPQSQR